ncbi:D-alanine aminotransferase [hydrothermal vent metagenome]|uniref:D-alanine aminotransferase n=1 Tax=hydrothermal vent metagenome TaxID=652676 RepID=A0A3B1AYM2_9ZZZZ
MPIVHLNGQNLPAGDACVPVLDRGFIFGDGVYEVIPVFGGHPFRLTEHLRRLENSLDEVRIPNPHTPAKWTALIQGLVDKNGGGDQSLYLQVTRGPAARDHALPENPAPTVFAMSNPLHPAAAETLAQGIKAITLDDIRWTRCHIKAISLLPNILLRQTALDAGAAEAILIRDGYATEGAASNLFAVFDEKPGGVLVTPPKGPRLLPGITRDVILELAGAHGIAHRESDIRREDLARTREIWVTSSTKEILPVTMLDDEPVGEGRPGPVFKKMYALYQTNKAHLQDG